LISHSAKMLQTCLGSVLLYPNSHSWRSYIQTTLWISQ